MPKPPFREYDPQPRRGDDIKLKAFGVEIEASGRIVILTIIASIATAVAVWGVIRNEAAHAAIWRAFEVQTCVLTLNEAERREYRTEGKYCPRPQTIRFRDDGVQDGRDERHRYSKR